MRAQEAKTGNVFETHFGLVIGPFLFLTFMAGLRGYTEAFCVLLVLATMMVALKVRLELRKRRGAE